MKELSSWKKAYEGDLEYICLELKDLLDTPACVILNGPVGAGKTTFVQYFSKILQKKEMNIPQGDLGKTDFSEITSPTYSIVNEQGLIAHADFYRLSNPEDIIHLELGLYCDNKKFFFVEWGVDYIDSLYSELGESFKYYELRIEPNQGNNDLPEDEKVISRNLSLFDLKSVISKY